MLRRREGRGAGATAAEVDDKGSRDSLMRPRTPVTLPLRCSPVCVGMSANGVAGATVLPTNPAIPLPSGMTLKGVSAGDLQFGFALCVDGACHERLGTVGDAGGDSGMISRSLTPCPDGAVEYVGLVMTSDELTGTEVSGTCGSLDLDWSLAVIL